MDKVLINDLVARGVIGIHDWERTHHQEIVLNLVLFTDTRIAGATDAIADCINYQTVAEGVRALAEGSKRLTVEALAHDVAQFCLREPGVSRVRVRVEKPSAVRLTRSVGVEIERGRDGTDE